MATTRQIIVRRLWGIALLLFYLAQPVHSADENVKKDIASEAKITGASIRSLLSETRREIARIDTFKSQFVSDLNLLTHQVAEYRSNLAHRKAFLDQIHRSFIRYNPGDTLTYSMEYWRNVTTGLKEEINTEAWTPDAQAWDDLAMRIDRFSGRLNHGGMKTRLVKEAVVALLKLSMAEPLDPAMISNVQDGIGSLRDVLSGTGWEPRILPGVRNTVLQLRSAVQKMANVLESLESGMLKINSQVNEADKVLSRRLEKLDGILNSFQVIESNLHSIEDYNPTEMRQQFIFLRNQNRFIDYPHSVLKSFNNSVEDAISGKNWREVLDIIAAQDPDFGAVDLTQNAVVLFVGAGEINRHYLIFEERGTASSYLYNIDSFTAVWLEDNTREIYEIDMSIELLQSEFEQTFGQFRQIWEAKTRGDDIPPEPTLYFYGMKRIDNVSSPAKINLSMRRIVMEKNEREGGFDRVEEINDVFRANYVIHEKSYLHVSVGLSAGFVKKSNFALDGNALRISHSGDRELDQHLYALVNYHLGARDVDRFEQYPMFSLQKFMVQAGIGISKHPLDRIYAGLGYRFMRDVQLDLLVYWTRREDPDQVVIVGDAATIQDAKARFDKKYDGGHLAIGLSFYPQKIFGLLGL
jgi:hypothetical protein